MASPKLFHFVSHLSQGAEPPCHWDRLHKENHKFPDSFAWPLGQLRQNCYPKQVLAIIGSFYNPWVECENGTTYANFSNMCMNCSLLNPLFCHECFVLKIPCCVVSHWLCCTLLCTMILCTIVLCTMMLVPPATPPLHGHDQSTVVCVHVVKVENGKNSSLAAFENTCSWNWMSCFAYLFLSQLLISTTWSINYITHLL